MSSPAPAASWLELAACRGRPTSLWYSGRPFDVAVAVAVCTSCRVRGECLADALELEVDGGYRFGVRGGLTAEQRRLCAGSPPERVGPVVADTRELGVFVVELGE